MNFEAFLSSNFLNKLKAVFGKTLYQTKFLQSNISVNNTLLTDYTLTKLEIGKTYRLTAMRQAVDGGQNVSIAFYNSDNNSNVIFILKNKTDAVGDEDRSNIGGSVIFTAQTTFITARYFKTGAGANVLEGNGTLSQSWYQIEELPNHDTTTKFN